MDPIDVLRAIGALILVLGLILGLTWIVRRYGGGLGAGGGLQRPNDLRVVEFRALDMRRKLAVVRWGDREHLICVGPAGDCVIGERPAPSDASTESDGAVQ